MVAINKFETHWHNINWKQVEEFVSNAQNDLVVAYEEEKFTKLHEMQYNLMMSFEARAYAVRQVTSNDGKKTPGVDNIIWKGTAAKTLAISELRRVVISPKSYKPQNIRKILIPKRNSNEQRPLGIPTILDRALQALIVLTLDPVVEARSDNHSYGSRKHRSPHDAINRLFQLLGKPKSPKWILDVDISKCFDNISHEFINKEVKLISCGVGKRFVKEWLKAGIVFKGSISYPEKGIPQGGVISPMLCNMVLNGLDELIRPGQPRHGTQKHKELAGCWAVRYVDDIIITSPTEDKLKNFYLPKLKEFLKERGLEVSKTKSRIINFEIESFEYLGWKFQLMERDARRSNKVSVNKLVLILKPTQEAFKRIKYLIKSVLKTQISMIAMIKKLNPIIRGWTNYYKVSIHSQGDFSRLSYYIYTLFWIWSRKVHPTKSKKWVKRKYVFIEPGTKRWQIGYNSKIVLLDPVTVKSIKTVVLKTDRNPYKDKDYFENRFKILDVEKFRKAVYEKHKYKCAACGGLLGISETIELHRLIPGKDGGTYSLDNVVPLHKTCHESVTFAKKKWFKHLDVGK